MDNLIGQQFGNRLVIQNHCDTNDWLKYGFKIPASPYKYVLTKCLSCGSILPADKKNLRVQPPKRCVFCSNIGNHSHIDTHTNTWAVYDAYAVCNIAYHDQIISAYVDIQDYDAIRQHVWRVSKKRNKYYVVSGSAKKGTAVYMHEAVYGDVDDGMEIDHIDGNSLKNRRNNLRMVSRQENIDNQIATRIDNTIGIRGIVYNKRSKTFKVDFHYHGRRYYTKEWHTIEEAVWCRKCFEDYFGIHALEHNPLANQYYTLNDEDKVLIHEYVTSKILGNER